MKRFRFRLEGLFRYRREQEREAVLEVQRVRREMDAAEQRIVTLQDERGAWMRVYSETGRKENATRELWLIEQYFSAIDQQVAHFTVLARRWREELDRVIELARGAMRARRQVEYLRERQAAEYQSEVRRADLRLTDEMNSLRYRDVEERRAWAQ
ncbi:MAG: flagellar export protein FliJ [Deltaproteobacteria bacterium]|nr:flagellar export protein FliJ [Deltaproteobacteria bacterium]